jgi:tight adherence protein B
VTLLAALAAAVVVASLAALVWSRLGGGPVAEQSSEGGSAARAVSRVRREEWLRQAGVDLTPLQLWALCGAAAIGTFGLVALATRTPLVAAAPAVAVGATPVVYLGHRRRIRLRAWQAAWPDALRELVAAIVAGRSLAQAINALGATGPEPLREVFADFPALARVFGTAAALEQVKERMADPTSDRVIEVLLVAQERGGAIVRDILEDLVVATTDDLKVLDEIDTEGLEMRINGRAVLVLPWLVLVALTVRPGPFRAFYGSTAGLLVIAAAAALSALGSWWLGRLGAQPDEPRVFAPAEPAAARRPAGR